ncbi:MAG: fibronectin type III domain-containing protein [Chitinophagales bacterium]|nr:fibronectin type III domain-containing protein [Chitinophagales bacterium]
MIVFADADGDGYGNASNDTLLCDSILPMGYVYDNTDCNDADATVNPNANEICSNGIDDNCNGQVDENCCAAPAGLATTNITNSSAQLNWNTVASATKYKVQWKRDSSGVAWNTITVTAPNTTTTITGHLPNSKYKWKVRSICGSMKSDFSAIVKFTTLLRMGNEVMKDNSVSVYPNPFDQSATISFMLDKTSTVEIDLFDLSGRKFTSIVSETLEQGEHQIPFNSKDLESGIYPLQLKLADEIRIIKIVVQ